MITNILLITSLIIIVYLDIKYNKIFNCLMYPLMGVGVFINYFVLGSYGIIYSAIGFFGGFCIGLIPYTFSLSGIGELKLLELVGIFNGWHFIVIAGLASYVVLTLVLLVSTCVYGYTKSLLANGKTYLELILQYGISISTIIEVTFQGIIIPYSFIISMITMVLLFIKI